MDTVVALTKTSYYVADYDVEADEFGNFCKVALGDVVKLEMGQILMSSQKMFRAEKLTPMPYIGITFKNDLTGLLYGHLWKSAGNNSMYLYRQD